MATGLKSAVARGADLRAWLEQLTVLVRSITDVPILNGALLSDIEVTSNQANKIPHPLKRPLIGWIVVRNPVTGVTFFDQQTVPSSATQANPEPDKTLWLFPVEVATSTYKISIWVF